MSLRTWYQQKHVQKIVYKGCMLLCGAFYVLPAISHVYVQLLSPESAFTLFPDVFPLPTDIEEYFKPYISKNNMNIKLYSYNYQK